MNLKYNKIKSLRNFWQRNSYESLLQAIARTCNAKRPADSVLKEIHCIADELRTYNISKEYCVDLNKKEIAALHDDMRPDLKTVTKASLSWVQNHKFVLYKEHENSTCSPLETIGGWWFLNKDSHVIYKVLKKLLRKMSVE